MVLEITCWPRKSVPSRPLAYSHAHSAKQSSTFNPQRLLRRLLVGLALSVTAAPPMVAADDPGKTSHSSMSQQPPICTTSSMRRPRPRFPHSPVTTSTVTSANPPILPLNTFLTLAVTLSMLA